MLYILFLNISYNINMNLKLKDSKGITIISLIITIMAMIIIAAISINSGLTSINSTQDSIIESSLETVQQSISQQYAEARTLNNVNKSIEATDSTELINNKPSSFIGTPLTNEQVKDKIEANKNGNEKLNLLKANNNNETYDNIYYQLNDNDLNKLGINDAEGQEYIVNYSTGEVWDISNVTYNSGEFAYINGISVSLEMDPESFVDSPINITIYEELKKVSNGIYKFSIKVTDDIAKITKNKNVINDPDDFNLGDILDENIIIEIDGKEVDKSDLIDETKIKGDNGKENPWTEIGKGISITSTVIPDENTPIGESYIYEIQINIPDDSTTEHTVSLTINPDTIIDDEGNTNAITEITTSSTEEFESDEIVFEFELENIQYQCKDSEGNPTESVTVLGDEWGTSASVDIKLTTEDKRGFDGQYYVFSYAWSTDSNFDWETSEEKQITISTRKGSKEAKVTVYLDSYSGKGTLYVRPLKSESGKTFNMETKSTPVNIDSEPPTTSVVYKNESEEWRPIEEYLQKENSYFRMKKRVIDGVEDNTTLVLEPEVDVIVEDTASGIIVDDYNAGKAMGWYYIVLHDDYDEAERWINTIQADSYRKMYGFSLITFDKDNNYPRSYRNNLYFVREGFDGSAQSGEYNIFATRNFMRENKYLEKYISDNVGNQLDEIKEISKLKLDLHAPKISNIEITDTGNGIVTISEDYSGFVEDFSKIKYAWVKSNDLDSSKIKWNTIKETQIISKGGYNEENNYKNLVFDAGYPVDTEEYYLAVTIDGTKDIAGNESTEGVKYSDETAVLDIFEYKLENQQYSSRNVAREIVDGITVAGDTWGQSSTVDIVLTSTGKLGLKNQYYEFEYVWNTTKDYNWDTNLTDIQVAYIRAVSGDKMVKATVKINSHSGKGYLHVRPRDEYETSSGLVLDTTPKSVVMNLDNIKPELKIQYEKNDGTIGDLETVVNDDSFYFTEEKINDSFNRTEPIIKFEFEDFESGIMPTEGAYGRFSFRLFNKEIYDNMVLDEDTLRKQAYERVISKIKIEDGYPRSFDATIYYPNQKTNLQRSISESGEYYLVVTNTTSLYPLHSLLDNVGNLYDDFKIIGPLKIDVHAPKIKEIGITEDGNSQINIVDDYSGLSNNYSKIKYGWVKDATSNPTKWSTASASQVSVNLSNDLGVPKDITIDVGYPPTGDGWNLCVKLEDYEDVAGNITNACTSELASDLKITLKEYSGIKYPTTVEYTIKSESGKKFEIKDIWYEHVGLNDMAGRISFDTYYSFNNTKGTINPITNGPIKLHVVDSIGREYISDEFIVKNVQETIVTLNVQANKLVMLPIEDVYNKQDVMLYVDWGDGNKNYINTSSFNMYRSNGLSYVEVYDNNPNSGCHVYGNTNQVTIKISGNLSTYWSNGRLSTGSTYADTTALDIIEYTRKTVSEVKQFGIHIDINAGNSTFDMEYLFAGCSNLSTICEYNTINENAFAKVDSMSHTFEGTAIANFDKRFLNNAVNIESFYGTFENCKNLKSIDVDLFDNCINTIDFSYTFANSGLLKIPVNSNGESIFKKNTKVESFDSTFSMTAIETIPYKLFQGNNAIEISMVNTFYSTNITSIPDNLFNNLNVSIFVGTFANCQNVKEISSKMFGNNIKKEATTSIQRMFKDCRGLNTISDELFKDFTNMSTANHLFENCISLTEVKFEIFKNCISLEEVAGMFYNCNSLKTVKPQLFDYSKDIIYKITWQGYILGNDGIDQYPYEGVFENCTVLEECPRLWEWSQFNSGNLIKEDTYDAYNGVLNSNIRNHIKNKGLEEWWLVNHIDNVT